MMHKPDVDHIDGFPAFLGRGPVKNPRLDRRHVTEIYDSLCLLYPAPLFRTPATGLPTRSQREPDGARILA